MTNSLEFILFMSFLVTLFMGGISYFSYRKHLEKELLYLTEFWASLGTGVLITYASKDGPPSVIALSMFAWLWPMRTMKALLGRSAKLWEFQLMSAGLFISAALYIYGQPFIIFTIPFALALSLTGLRVTYESFKKSCREDRTPCLWSVHVLMGLYFLTRLSFPFWRMDAVLMGLTLDLVTLIGLSATGLVVYMEVLKKKHALLADQKVKERDGRFYHQSKYSDLGMISAGIAHEINNPLAVIQARTTQLLRIYRDPTRQGDLADGLQQILYTSERINRTIQGIREFVHQDENESVEDINLKDLFDDVLAFCGQRMRNHGISLRFYGLEDFTVRGNKVQLEQIVLNLFNNSLDAIEFLSDKWIEVSVHREDENVRIYFKDSGHGIAREVATKIMEPFFSTKDLGKGTGLGLALARGIAEKHGGSLEYIYDCPHTTFRLELPDVLH